MLMRRSASPGNAMAAISYFEQAVALDPNLADAWGALAISYCEPRRGIPTSTRLIASAAKRALALDPHQPEGQLALIRIEPEFGRWLDHEQRLRSIVHRHPDHPLSVGSLGMLLESVGRFEEAIAFYRHMLDVEPSLPFGWARLSVAQHYAGREYEADTSIEAGFMRFPAHMLLWLSRFHRFHRQQALCRCRHLCSRFRQLSPDASAAIPDVLCGSCRGTLSRGRGSIELYPNSAGISPAISRGCRDRCPCSPSWARLQAFSMRWKPSIWAAGTMADASRAGTDGATSDLAAVRARSFILARRPAPRRLAQADRAGRLLAQIGHQAGLPPRLRPVAGSGQNCLCRPN